MVRPGSEREGLAAALSELRAGRPDAAEAIARRLLARAPRSPALHQLRAAIALQQGAGAVALRWARSCLAMRPDHAPVLLIAGRAARAAGEAEAALAYFGRAAELAPTHPEPVFMACVLLLDVGTRGHEACWTAC